MDKTYLKTLELDKILAQAAEYATCAEARALLLEQPACENAEETRFALSQTDAINSLLLKNGSPRFGGVNGVNKIVSRAVKGGVLSMAELLEVAGALRNFQNLVSWYHISEHDLLPVDDLFYALTPQPALEKAISESILSPEEMADTASNTLFEVRRKIQATENSIRDKLDAIIKNSTTNKFLQDAVVSLRNGRFVVPVKAEYRGEVGGVIHDVSSTGATVFVEPTAVVEANARIMQLRSQEKAEIERILVAFTEQVAGIEPVFSFSYQAMLEIDVLLAKAQLALEQKAYMPQVADGVWFDLKKARHPLIDKTKVVPIDVALGREYDTLVITGPNTGGKTVTLKTIGLLTLMAQCGLHIPVADDSRVMVFDHVLADIGDEQSIAQNLSTFSSHMVNIVGILGQCGPGTLILFDELGAGTDPVEGAALAASIIESARERGALVAATTHYAELKVYAMTTRGVENASCEFDVETLAPTYKLLIGVPGKSNAFAISRRLGLPQAIIDKAAERIDAENVRFEDVLTQLDRQRQEMEREKDAARRLRREMEDSARTAREYRERLEKEKAKAVEKAQAEARAIIREARDTADQVFAELNDMRRRQEKEASWQEQNDRRAGLRRRLNEAEDAIGGGREDLPPPPPTRPAAAGDTVELVKMGTRATVLSVNRDGGLQLQAGILKITARQSEVRVVEGEAQKTQKEAQRFVQRAEHKLRSLGASPEVDLRGMMTDEAIGVLDQFLDSAVMGKLTQVTVIHGKGTGAVRKAVREHLRRSRYVKTFRPGRYGEGEDGVTVVELK